MAGCFHFQGCDEMCRMPICVCIVPGVELRPHTVRAVPLPLSHISATICRHWNINYGLKKEEFLGGRVFMIWQNLLYHHFISLKMRNILPVQKLPPRLLLLIQGQPEFWSLSPHWVGLSQASHKFSTLLFSCILASTKQPVNYRIHRAGPSWSEYQLCTSNWTFKSKRKSHRSPW